RYSPKNTMKVLKRRTERQSAVTNFELADRVFMRAGSFFDDRNCAADSALSLEEPQEYNVVCEIGDIDRGFHVANKSMLGDREECGYPRSIQKLQEFVHVQNEGLLLGHGLLVTIETINNDSSDGIVFYAPAHAMSELAGRKLCRIDLLDDQFSLLMKGFKIDAHCFGATKQKAQLFVKDE